MIPHPPRDDLSNEPSTSNKILSDRKQQTHCDPSMARFCVEKSVKKKARKRKLLPVITSSSSTESDTLLTGSNCFKNKLIC